MSHALNKYRRRQTSTARWPLTGDLGKEIQQVVVIPCLNESQHLFDTLADLSANPSADLAQTLVIVVVNNRPPEDCPAEWIADNQRTLARLQEEYLANSHTTRLRLAVIDASSPGHEIPPQRATGFARRIGLDWAFEILVSRGLTQGAMVNLDADTHVPSDYLGKLLQFFGSGHKRWGVQLKFQHQTPATPQHQAAIQTYERYLAYHRRGLEMAGSPYAWTPLGSGQAVTAEAYAAIGGMNLHLAGEDFYYLQQLIKTGWVETIPDLVIFPSARPSTRAIFGTGQSLLALTSKQQFAIAPDPRCYLDLARLRYTLYNGITCSAQAILDWIGSTKPEMADFLSELDFVKVWPSIQKQHHRSRGKQQHEKHPLRGTQPIDTWLDGLQSYRLINRLSQECYKRYHPEEAMTQLQQVEDQFPSPAV